MKIKENLLKYIFILLAVFGLSMSLAEPWSLKVIVKRPYLAEHYDSLGNLAPDSLVRNRKIATIIYKSGMVDSLLSEAVTNDSGFVVFDFTQWHDGSAVDSSDVGRIDIAFPTTYEAIKIGEKTTFRKLRYESVLFKGRQFEEISIILPLLSVNLNEYTIGAGNFTYDIVIMTDTHIGEFGGGDSDFGSDGYDDYDDDPYETSVPIANMWSGVLFINEQLIAGGYPIKFIAYTGDVSSSSERSEYQRAITLLSALTPYSPSPPYDRIFYISIMGNHDAWPYTPNEEMPSSSVIIGDYFYDAFKSQYDSLLCCFPLPQWQESPLLFTPTDVTGQTYPSHYLNFAFDYQQYRFISTDFNSREHAGPGINRDGEVDKGEPWDHTWDWLDGQVTPAMKQKIIVLAHHPYCLTLGGPWTPTFTAHELHQISDAGLLYNKPIARSIGGHIHGVPGGDVIGWVPYNDDTICYVYGLNGAMKDGDLYLFHIKDSVNLLITQPEGNPVLPVTVYFQASYSYQGSYNAPADPHWYNYYWDFGDGACIRALTPTHIYRLYNSLDTLFKVSLTVTKCDGRKVSCVKIIQVTASPFNLHTEYIKEDSVKLVWDFDQPTKVDYYIIKRNGQQIGTSTTKSFIDTQNIGLQRGQIYNYEVSVHYKSNVGHADSPAVKLYNVQVPWLDAPMLRAVTELSPNQVRLSWHNNSQYTINYTISRWDTLHGWQDSYKTNWNDTLFTDTVSFCYKYRYRVKAKDNQGNYSAWPNTVEFTSGVLAQSGYSKMSAYNCNQKVVMSPNGKIHLISFNGQDVFYALSPDGYNFSTWKWLNYPEFTVDTIPALAIDNSGIPRIVYGERVQSKVTYYVRDTSSSFPDMIYQSAITSANPYPPSFIWAGDTGWIVFKDPDSRVVVARYPPPFVQVITPPIDGGNPVIGYDRGSVGQLGRFVVLVHNEGYGPLTLYWRQIGSAAWNSVDIPSQYSVYGAPSLWTGTNEIRMTFEGETAQQEALFFLRVPWNGISYDMNQPIELISTNFDYDEINGLEGYSYPAGRDVVLWKYQDDIYNSQRVGGEWTTPQNISNTTDAGDISSYPQGIVFGSALRQKLFALWTEKVGDAYYLVRKIINIPSAYPVVRTVAQIAIPEATAYNNSRRLLRDKNNALHLVYTDAENVYHTFLKDTAWSAPQLIGTGKYPALTLADNGTLYCIWCYNGYQDFNGDTVYVEYLMMSSNNSSSWSDPAILYHTYGSFLWGVGAPSLAIKDTTAYVVFKTYHGPTYNPPPGGQTLPVIILDGPALIYGKFSINHPEFSCQMLDAINWANPIPTDTSIYPDSLVPLLVSPSIAVDQNNIPHVLWEGDSTAVRYYTVNPDTVIRELFDNHSAFPSLAMNGDRIDLFWTSRDSIRYRYGWTGTANLSRTQTVAACASPYSSGPYITWTKPDGFLSYLNYGAIPASGPVTPIELNYSTDRIGYPQILYNPSKNNTPTALDFVWTEFNPAESLGYIYYLNLPVDNPPPTYGLDMGTEIPVPVLVHRDGYQVLGDEDYQTFDYDSTELTYHLTLHSPHEKYKIIWIYYHQEPNKVKLQFNIDDILHRNCWVNPGEKVTEEAWISQSCLEDNEITIKVKKLSGTIAVLSGIEIYIEEAGSGGGPQGDEIQLTRPFFLENIYPNPARGILKVRFNSPDERMVTMKLYDVAGRLAEKMFDGNAKIGMNRISLLLNNLATGVYFIQTDAGNYNKVEKIILLR